MSDYISDGEIHDYEDERRRSLETELLKLASEVSYVRGHLEVFAAALERKHILVDYGGRVSGALREDIRRLAKLGEGQS